MIDPASGPFLFDTSAESKLGRATQSADPDWMREYPSCHQASRDRIEAARVAYLINSGRVRSLNRAAAVVAAEIMALLPDPPTPPRRSHHSRNPGRSV